MTHSTPLRPVRRMYHDCLCPACGWHMHPDGKCTHCAFDYAVGRFRRPAVALYAALVCGGLAGWLLVYTLLGVL